MISPLCQCQATELQDTHRLMMKMWQLTLHCTCRAWCPYVQALDIVQYTAISTVKQQLRLKKTISLAMAKRWMRKMGYRWTKKPGGQYVNGHEWADIVPADSILTCMDRAQSKNKALDI